MLKGPKAPITSGEPTIGHLPDTKKEKKRLSAVILKDLLKNIMRNT